MMIATHFIPALINGDYTGFELDSDGGELSTKQIDDFQTLYTGAHFEIVCDELHIELCEVCGLMAECLQINVHPE